MLWYLDTTLKMYNLIEIINKTPYGFRIMPHSGRRVGQPSKIKVLASTPSSHIVHDGISWCPHAKLDHVAYIAALRNSPLDAC